eukprot:CAMPEP_0204365974 /NCGR_PEP_ID=MMETSP0469-20131031/42312_1 /ASSEMBLY_ACC=CAM_ASM_000384 /TAXON_ID=2969 /ORGANISM="Oxyrrhis marina" /LENGTH=41 /DNA_ID= /DNA_START= /DNA_END= /DNA_ORIENTATION=
MGSAGGIVRTGRLRVAFCMGRPHQLAQVLRRLRPCLVRAFH